MSWATNSFHQFGGLDLVSAPDTSLCLDMLNVDLDVRDAIRTRDGFTTFGSALTNQPDSLFAHYESDGTTQLLVGNGIRLDALDSTGASVANVATTASPHFFAHFGGPTAEVTYIANGTDQVRAWDGTAFSSPAGLATQTGMFLAVTPTSNRLMSFREAGTTAGNNPSSVNFSDAGIPETFPVDNYVDLDPGDGEAISGGCAWREYVFVFKPSKFWVYYGESVDSVGEAVFNFRKVDTGVGLVAPKAVWGGRDGVYFLDRTGVYRTTGGAPELVSSLLDPLFIGALPPHYEGLQVSQANIAGAALTWHRERIYLALPSGATNDIMLVFDPRYGYWCVWNIAAAALASFRISSIPELVFAYATGANQVGRHSSSQLTDGGSAILSRYRIGFYDLGFEGLKRTRRVTLWGVGNVSYANSKDFSALDAVTAVTLGVAPAIARDSVKLAKNGHLFSHEFSASSGRWIIHRCGIDYMPNRADGSEVA